MKAIILVLLLIPIMALADEYPCGDVKEKRIIKGTEPTASMLYENIKHIKNGSWKNRFWKETFTYIGEVHTPDGKIYKIGFLTTIWGESCRATNRLFVFGNDNICIGQYGGVTEAPLKISGSKLFFPFNEEYGNKIDFSNGPPSQIWLDGENPEWMPAIKKSSNIKINSDRATILPDRSLSTQ